MPSQFVTESPVMRRHRAAMEIIEEIDPDDRILLLAYVLAGTERIRELEEQEAA
jgi:hypothetical protein